MPSANVNGVTIEYAEVGTGFPLLWCHELAGSMESWLPQVTFFSRYYRVITYNARGYPPSSVPEDGASYSQDIAVADAFGLLQHLGISKAHVGGLSMGAATALHLTVQHPEIAKSLVVAGIGTGSTDPETFRQQCEAMAAQLEAGGMAALADYTGGPTRVQFRRKNPVGWQEFADLFGQHSAKGKAMVARGYLGARPPIFSFEERLKQLDVPTLIVVGDEDEPCLQPSLFLKQTLKRAGLVVLPQSGHTINLEEPQLFNRAVFEFLAAVENDKWPERSEGTGVGFLATLER